MNVIDYVLQMRGKLEKITKLAAETFQEAQRRQKCWYDRKARERSFKDQQVLVMFPTEEKKLLGKWKGPFKITRKLKPDTFEIATPGGSHLHRTSRINLLKEWFPQKGSANVNLIRLVEDEEETEEQYLLPPQLILNTYRGAEKSNSRAL